jgi:hypothetical protein
VLLRVCLDVLVCKVRGDGVHARRIDVYEGRG